MWSTPMTAPLGRRCQLNPGFIRNIQVTGDLQGSGRVYVAAMNEGTGGLSTRQNVMYRSTDGGVSWTSTNAGPSFQAPGRATCSQQTYFACMFNNGITIWRHMGWGQPAASGNVVSLTYAACGHPSGAAAARPITATFTTSARPTPD